MGYHFLFRLAFFTAVVLISDVTSWKTDPVSCLLVASWATLSGYAENLATLAIKQTESDNFRLQVCSFIWTHLVPVNRIFYFSDWSVYVELKFLRKSICVHGSSSSLQVSQPTGESAYRWVSLQVGQPTGESAYR